MIPGDRHVPPGDYRCSRGRRLATELAWSLAVLAGFAVVWCLVMVLAMSKP